MLDRHLLRAAIPVLLLLSTLSAGCVVVPQNRRGHLNDPTMSLSGERLDLLYRRKVYTSREGASGGDGLPAGGGCGCSN